MPGSVEPLGDEGRRHRCVGGDTDHPGNRPLLAMVALGRRRRVLGAVHIGDQPIMRKGKSRRVWIDVGDDDMQTHLSGALGGIGRLDPARYDQERPVLAHQK
jgi:hypothetical protein